MENEISLDYLKKFITPGQAHMSSWSLSTLETSFEIKPEEFLQYAENDLTSNSPHKLINALSNIKRALSCQIDSLLIEFVLFDRPQKESWGLPKKIEVLSEIGLVLPNVLKKINQRRNLLEHEYKNPSNEEVEDALGIVSLFIVYTQKFTEKPFGDLTLYNEGLGVELNLELDRKKKRLIFFEYYSTKQSLKKRILKEVDADSSDYKEYLKTYVNIYYLG